MLVAVAHIRSKPMCWIAATMQLHGGGQCKCASPRVNLFVSCTACCISPCCPVTTCSSYLGGASMTLSKPFDGTNGVGGHVWRCATISWGAHNMQTLLNNNGQKCTKSALCLFEYVSFANDSGAIWYPESGPHSLLHYITHLEFLPAKQRVQI